MNAFYTSKEHSLHSSTLQMFVRFESNSAEVIVKMYIAAKILLSSNLNCL